MDILEIPFKPWVQSMSPMADSILSLIMSNSNKELDFPKDILNGILYTIYWAIFHWFVELWVLIVFFLYFILMQVASIQVFCSIREKTIGKD